MPLSAILATIVIIIIRAMMKSKNPDISSLGLKLLGLFMLIGLIVIILGMSGVIEMRNYNG